MGKRKEIKRFLKLCEYLKVYLPEVTPVRSITIRDLWWALNNEGVTYLKTHTIEETFEYMQQWPQRCLDRLDLFDKMNDIVVTYHKKQLENFNHDNLRGWWGSLPYEEKYMLLDEAGFELPDIQDFLDNYNRLYADQNHIAVFDQQLVYTTVDRIRGSKDKQAKRRRKHVLALYFPFGR